MKAKQFFIQGSKRKTENELDAAKTKPDGEKSRNESMAEARVKRKYSTATILSDEL